MMGGRSWAVSTVRGGQAAIASKWAAWKLGSFARQQDILRTKTRKLA